MSDAPRKPRVMHFVTGGFSGATQVAINLCLAAQRSQTMQAMLVLRKKRGTDMRRVQSLREQGLQVELVPGWAHWATRWALRRLCTRWQPDVMVAHGFPEHILGRQAALAARVPHLLQVEHNSRERYTPARLRAALALVPHTDRLIGVSEGVRRYMVSLGFKDEQTMAIPNGIELQRFAKAADVDFATRSPGIVMAARFASQKDHLTLVQALAVLRDTHGLTPNLYLAGGGKARRQRVVEREIERLGLAAQVKLLGHHPDMPGLLMSQRICVLSTHFEGMPLALVEGMAAGCACVGSDVPGVHDVIRSGRSGLLVPHADSGALAAALALLLTDNALAQRLGHGARQQAVSEHGMALMLDRYEALIRACASGTLLQPAPQRAAQTE